MLFHQLNGCSHICKAKKLTMHVCHDLSVCHLYEGLNCVQYENLNELETININNTNIAKKEMKLFCQY